jgi:hypothetical protein
MNAGGVRAQNKISRALRITTALTMAQHDRQDARLPPVLNAMQAYQLVLNADTVPAI